VPENPNDAPVGLEDLYEADILDEYDEYDSALFEERAENLTSEQFSAWTHVSEFEETTIRQLTNQSPRLLSGPRGCGKSTLLLLAAERIARRPSDVPIYVNYGKSMFIEPAFNQRTDADGFFQDWLVARIVTAAHETLELSDPLITELADRCKSFVEAAEIDPTTARLQLPGPSQLARLLTSWAQEAGKSRIVLLLDDAAHAFVPEQQRIFFEFLRNLRSTAVTYKAAIYPGVTEFSPNFHVGHDAKVVNAWPAVEGDQYLDFMHELFTKRLPEHARTHVSRELVDLFAGASFGIPRTFLSMIEAYLDNVPSNPGRITNAANAVIADHAQQLRKLFQSMAQKLPTYRRYVEAGGTVEARLISELREINKTRHARSSESRQALDVAVKQPIDKRLATIFSLLEYAGIVRQTNESFSDGRDGVFTRFSLHRAVLLEGNALIFGQNPTLRHRASSLVRGTRSDSYKKVTGDVLLTPELAADCTLDIGVCRNCGEPRELQDARFCPKCGKELADESRFNRLVRTPVVELPLTPKKVKALTDVGFVTVEDIIRDRGHEELRKAHRVGEIWARRIHTAAEEFVSV
jgi:hypothetical protein